MFLLLQNVNCLIARTLLLYWNAILMENVMLLYAFKNVFNLRFLATTGW